MRARHDIIANGLTRRHAVSLATLPSRKARDSAARNEFQTRLQVSLARRFASSSSASFKNPLRQRLKLSVVSSATARP